MQVLDRASILGKPGRRCGKPIAGGDVSPRGEATFARSSSEGQDPVGASGGNAGEVSREEGAEALGKCKGAT
jgi:hypothetical protein